jgi:RNase P/RNase MRP subunit p30
MRRRKLSSLIYDQYPTASQAEKEIAQELVFQYYYDRNDQDLELALSEITGDIVRLEHIEQYERCMMLKDILDRFE